MKIAWLCYLDPFVFTGGGEMNNRALIEAGRLRGHKISVSPWLRGRPQRLLRRFRINSLLRVSWDADVFVLANIRNMGPRSDPFPSSVVKRALGTGRAIIFADAWVDVCPLDLPCDGDTTRCPRECSRDWGNLLFGSAIGAVFVSPMQHRLTAKALDVPLPATVIHARPAVDPAKFRPLGLERDIDVLYAGTINEAKGYDNLLRRFGAESVTFVGNNSLGHPVQGIDLGSVRYEDMPAIYNRAKTFAHLPNWNEPMGRTVVEAALCGCELVLNERVGVTSYETADWQDSERVAGNVDRFWDDFESAFTPTT